MYLDYIRVKYNQCALKTLIAFIKCYLVEYIIASIYFFMKWKIIKSFRRHCMEKNTFVLSQWPLFKSKDTDSNSKN